MAVAPLFIVDMATLRAGLRLSGAVSGDATAMIDNAVLTARVGMFDRLGQSRIEQILTTATSDTPTTLDQRNRAKANLVESLWVRVILLEQMPVLLMDSENITSQEWNENGLTRNLSSRLIQDLIESLNAQIDDLIDGILGSPDTTPGFSVATIGPLVTPPRPFDTVFGRTWCRA